MRSVLLAVLCLEVVAFGLSIPVMIFVSERSGVLAGCTGGGTALLALVAAALLRKPIGFVVGWLAQLAGVALGFLTPSMFVVGLMFLALWVVTIVLGRRLDAAQRQRDGGADMVSP